MSVVVAVLIPAKVMENVNTIQYTSPANVKTIIDKITATNYGASAASFSLNIVTVAGFPGNANIISKSIVLQPNETWVFPEIVGYSLDPGDYISTIAGTADSINLRASGRRIT